MVSLKLFRKKLSKSNSVTFKSMFDYYIELLVSLSSSLLAMNVLYLIFSVLTWNSNLELCMIIGVLLHYFLLGSFAWMLCFSILQYLTFNKVLFVINKFYLKAAIFSLGIFEENIFIHLDYIYSFRFPKKVFHSFQ